MFKQILAAATMALSLSSCQLTTDNVGQALAVASVIDTSKDQQQRLGAAVARDVLGKSRRSSNKALENKLQRMTNQIARANNLNGFNWKVYLLASRDPNAFTGGGGFVFVEEGMIPFTRNEASMAMLLSHEMAHVTKAHSVKSRRDQVLVGALASALGGNGGITQLGQQAFASQYSQGNEREADAVGLRYMVNAGYNPTAGADILIQLSRLQQSRPSFGQIFAASHPTNESRIRALRTQTAGLPVERRNSGITSTREYDQLTARYRR